MRKGTYETKGFEIQFSDLGNSPALEIPVDETSTIHLTGRIDRLDVCELEDAILYKVIDYKSGNRSFDLLNTYYGISMQLVVYLAVASEMGKHTQTEKKVIPAGAFYFHIDDPTFKDISEDTIQEEKMKAFQMNGVLNTTEQALCTLDTELGSLGGGFNENVKSGVIKASTKKDKTLSSRMTIMEQEHFDDLSKHVSNTMRSFGNEMLQGEIAVKPYRLGNECACTYCSYQAICGFDTRLPGYSYRKVQGLSEEEIWEKIRTSQSSHQNKKEPSM